MVEFARMKMREVYFDEVQEGKSCLLIDNMLLNEDRVIFYESFKP